MQPAARDEARPHRSWMETALGVPHQRMPSSDPWYKLKLDVTSEYVSVPTVPSRRTPDVESFAALLPNAPLP
ncbi:hypothetical protein M8818_007069 [Zalaria obscura]|uniref:Uncharacterized protein n=1 Tax=Zalaria obscura TaxID=2024903 RepID=A0ACC3S3Y2_9PEZI